MLNKEKHVLVIQGDYYVSDQPNEVITTILGSCVAVCLYDPVVKIGGLNHFLLPGFCDSSSGTTSCGLNMMELLINALQKKGAKRNRMRAKMFGGAQMRQGLTDIGKENVDFTQDFLRHEGIPCISQSVGGLVGRRLRFWPATGEVKQLFLSPYETQEVEKQVLTSKTNFVAPASDIELF